MPEYPILAREHALTRRGAEQAKLRLGLVGAHICSAWFIRKRRRWGVWTVELEDIHVRPHE